MGKLVTCTACGGFRRGLVCPHCGKKGALVRALGGALGGGAIAFTLMACYGVAPCPEGNKDCRSPGPTSSDGGASMPKASDSQDAPVAK